MLPVPLRLINFLDWSAGAFKSANFRIFVGCNGLRGRPFSQSIRTRGEAPLPPRTPLPPKDYTIAYLKGSGPGGQKINKTSSAVQIKHLPTGLVIKCQDTRSRDQNEKLAMRRLQDKLEMAEKAGTGELSRVERRWELLRKRKASKAKKSKRKYRALEAAKAEAADNADEMDTRAASNDVAEGGINASTPGLLNALAPDNAGLESSFNRETQLNKPG